MPTSSARSFGRVGGLGGGLGGSEIMVEIDFIKRQLEAHGRAREVVNIQASGEPAVVKLKVEFGEFDFIRCGGQAALGQKGSSGEAGKSGVTRRRTT